MVFSKRYLIQCLILQEFLVAVITFVLFENCNLKFGQLFCFRREKKYADLKCVFCKYFDIVICDALAHMKLDLGDDND